MKDNTILVAWFLAIRTMLKNKKTLAIISMVLAMSFISLTFFGAIINGLTYKFENQIIDGSVGHVLIEPNDDVKYIENANNLLLKLSKLPLTVEVSKRIRQSATVETDGISLSKTLIGIDPDEESDLTSVSSSMLAGDYLKSTDMNDIVIGSALVKSYSKKTTSKMLDVAVGDDIEIYFNNGVHETFNIKGIYRTGASFNDGEIFINDDKIFQLYPELTDLASDISIKLPDRGYEQEYRDQLVSTISVRDKVSDWTQKTDKIASFTGSLVMVNSVTYIMGILTAIATIYIIIFIDVIHKRKQIGILKAVGIRKNSILWSFIIQAFVYGLLGVITGFIVIIIMTAYFKAHPMKMVIGPIIMLLDYAELIKSSILLVVSSVAAGFIPAYAASKENILDAIFGG